MHVIQRYPRDLSVQQDVRVERIEVSGVWLTEDIEITGGDTNVNKAFGIFVAQERAESLEEAG